MSSSSVDRPRRVAAAASLLTVIAVCVGVLVLALGVGVPEAWWPQTGQAFATDPRPAHEDPCALILGSAKAYCERAATTFASAEPHGVAQEAWRLVSAGAGLAALVMWRSRSTAGQRRR